MEVDDDVKKSLDSPPQQPLSDPHPTEDSTEVPEVSAAVELAGVTEAVATEVVENSEETEAEVVSVNVDDSSSPRVVEMSDGVEGGGTTVAAGETEGRECDRAEGSENVIVEEAQVVSEAVVEGGNVEEATPIVEAVEPVEGISEGENVEGLKPEVSEAVEEGNEGGNVEDLKPEVEVEAGKIEGENVEPEVVESVEGVNEGGNVDESKQEVEAEAVESLFVEGNIKGENVVGSEMDVAEAVESVKEGGNVEDLKPDIGSLSVEEKIESGNIDGTKLEGEVAMVDCVEREHHEGGNVEDSKAEVEVLVVESGEGVKEGEHVEEMKPEEEVKVVEGVNEGENMDELNPDQQPVEELPASERAEEVPMADEKAEDIPMVTEKEEEAPMMDERVEEVPKMDERVEEVPMMDERVEEVLQSVEKTEEVAMMGEKVEEVPMVGEKAEEVPMVDEKAEEVLPVDVIAEEVPVVDEIAAGSESTQGLVEEKAGSDEQRQEIEVKQEDEEVKSEEEGSGEAEDKGGEEETDGSPAVTKGSELVAAAEEGTPIADTDVETESDTIKSGSGSGGIRKRGRASKTTPVKAPSRKIVGEDVCFICLDGGNLVLCDRRGCPKAYHPSCVDRDDEFFKTKGRWNCGWHLCNQCGKNAHFMCYTCTFSLCKGCCKDAAIFCMRGSKGLCESCMKSVMVIEDSKQYEMGQDLFADYWIEQKGKFSITSDELAKAKNPWKDSDKQQTHGADNDTGADSDNSMGNQKASGSKRKKAKKKPKSADYDTDSSLEKDTGTGKRKVKRRLKSQAKEANSDSEHSSQDTSNKRGKRGRSLSKSRSKKVNSDRISAEWASKELLEFVMHMKDGDKSVLTQFDVQGLLLEYIKRNKLRDPQRRSQIICDSMLQKLFGKPRVGHFEMLKLLESHFFLKEDSHADDNQGSIADTDVSQLDVDDPDSVVDASRSRGKKSRKRSDDRGLQSNLDDYAAIDMHNISLIFLRRNLMEGLMEDPERFHDKVVGAFVRIRISGSSQKQDIYRLVQIIGTSKAAETYKVGKRTTDVMLEILNLDKTEIISIDTISNQEFTEDECKRLRQSIKCGLINRMTVGDVVDKVKQLQQVRVLDWLDAEILRLSHLRDRASEKGRKKELRECVEKLQLLKTPEERQRRLDEIPEVHADPKMDPGCDSEDENETDTTLQATDTRQRDSGYSRRGGDHFSPRNKGGSVSNESWSANARPPNKKWELNRNLSGRGFSNRREEQHFASPPREHTSNNGSNSWEKPRLTSDPASSIQAEYSGVRTDMSASSASPHPSTVTGQTDLKINDTEKIWHYRDPTGKVQGPFSMAQLRKWSNTGYFPTDLRIWRASQTENDSTLLTEALAGRFQKDSASLGSNSDNGHKMRNTISSIETSKLSENARGSETRGRYVSSNLPSPTPARSPFKSSDQFGGGNERLPSPTPTSPSSDPSSLGRSNFSHQSKAVVAANKGENVTTAIGLVQAASGQFFSTQGSRPDISSNVGSVNPQPAALQSVARVGNPNTIMNQSNPAPNASAAGQGVSNVVQPNPGQNPPVYAQGWASGYAARPEAVNGNLTASQQNSVGAQIAYGQWTGAAVNNQASSYGAGYSQGQGNIATNYQAMPSQNAWRPAPTNMPWSGQQQQSGNQNMGWTGPPTAPAYGQLAGTSAGSMGQQAGSMPVGSAVAAGTTSTGWSGAGTGANLSAGSTNPGWVGSPANTGGRGGDQNRNGGGGNWNRQSPYGSGGGQRVCKFHESGHCKKGASCDYMHT